MIDETIEVEVTEIINNEERKIPFYFTIPWIILMVVLSGLITPILFGLGRGAYRKGQPSENYQIWGFIMFILGLIGSIIYYIVEVIEYNTC